MDNRTELDRRLGDWIQSRISEGCDIVVLAVKIEDDGSYDAPKVLTNLSPDQADALIQAIAEDFREKRLAAVNKYIVTGGTEH